MFLPTILDRQGSCPDTEFHQKWESLLMTTYYWTGFHVLTWRFAENGSPCCDTPPHKNWSHNFSNEENESHFHWCRRPIAVSLLLLPLLPVGVICRHRGKKGLQISMFTTFSSIQQSKVISITSKNSGNKMENGYWQRWMLETTCK